MCSTGNMGNCKSKKEEDNLETIPESDKHHMKISHGQPSPSNNNNNSQQQNNNYHEDTAIRRELPNVSVINAIKVEVNQLLGGIHSFKGTTETDKNYRYLDEMLTRCILKLDKLNCSNLVERGNRKETIKGVNQAITILERKLEINSDITNLECKLSSTSTSIS